MDIHTKKNGNWIGFDVGKIIKTSCMKNKEIALWFYLYNMWSEFVALSLPYDCTLVRIQYNENKKNLQIYCHILSSFRWRFIYDSPHFIRLLHSQCHEVDNLNIILIEE